MIIIGSFAFFVLIVAIVFPGVIRAIFAVFGILILCFLLYACAHASAATFSRSAADASNVNRGAARAYLLDADTHDWLSGFVKKHPRKAAEISATGGGALLGAGAGLFLGGPVGAVLGASIGAVAGAYSSAYIDAHSPPPRAPGDEGGKVIPLPPVGGKHAARIGPPMAGPNLA